MSHFTLTTQSLGGGSEACYVVYFERQVVATFPINDPGSSDARERAKRFMDTEYRVALELEPEPDLERDRR